MDKEFGAMVRVPRRRARKMLETVFHPNHVDYILDFARIHQGWHSHGIYVVYSPGFLGRQCFILTTEKTDESDNTELSPGPVEAGARVS